MKVRVVVDHSLSFVINGTVERVWGAAKQLEKIYLSAKQKSIMILLH